MDDTINIGPTGSTVVQVSVDDLARRMWASDRDSDPMLHTSWEATKDDYRRRVEVVLEALR